MSGLFRIVALATLVGVPEVCAGQSAEQPGPERVLLTASVAAGWIEGVVTDERRQPVAGAAVTAQGRDFLIIETDAAGRFTIRGVPAGTYLLRVQSRGYAASRREFVQVVPARGTRYDVRLRRTETPAAAAAPPRVLAASVGMTQAAAGAPPRSRDPEPVPLEDAVEDVAHDHSPAAWRLRHVKRSVLRETTSRWSDGLQLDDELWDDRPRFDVREWTRGLGRSTAGALLHGAVAGRVQLLTTGAFDQPFSEFGDHNVPAGVAYLNVGGPVSTRTSWAVEAATGHGSVTSWFVGGSYATVLADKHGIDVRSSYSRQRYDGGNAAALAAFADGSRNVGGVQVVDRWTVTPRALVTIGGRYEHYDYLQKAGLFSPSVSVAVSPAARTWVRVTVGQNMTAAGAEEFVPQAYGSLSLPPQRTFAPLVAGAPLDRQVMRHVSIALEQDAASFRIGVRHFRQLVDDQLVTVFGIESPDGRPRSDLGHYSVANGGSYAADGWGVSISRPMASHVRGAIEYRVAHASWTEVGDVEALGRWAPSAIRGLSERLHDVTTRVDADVPVTATRILATYRFNTSYTRDEIEELVPGADTRFDVQVYQALPFLNVSRARFELVFAVRNLFRDSRDVVSSVYDELLVVRPPKRVVGGLTVQF
ncbi:MAG TPA: TonB-dependent receptor [Vicinamibacterales bacterium]